MTTDTQTQPTANQPKDTSKQSHWAIRIVGEGLIVGALTTALILALLWFGN